VNLLEGLTDVAQITTFKATATIPASTTLGVQFSENGTDWHDHNGKEGEYSSLSDGENTIDLRALDWTTANFYYRARFTTSDPSVAATLGEVEVEYSDSYTPYQPAWDGGYHLESTIVSTNLLAGNEPALNGAERFGYDLTSLPSGTSVSVQFSVDGVNFYSSDGTLWGWDTLLSGRHLDDVTSIDLSALEWEGETSFYYKLKFTTDGSNAPQVADAGLLRRLAVIQTPPPSPSESPTLDINSGLLGYWSFDGPDVNTASNVAYDRSGEDSHGSIDGAIPILGKRGQGMSCDGTNDRVTVSNFQLSISDKFSLSLWINFEALSTGKPIVSQWGNSQNNIMLKLDDINADELRFCVASSVTDDCANFSHTTDANLVSGSWYNLSVIYDGEGATDADKLKMHLNGTQKTLTFSGNIPATLQNPVSTLELCADADIPAYLSAKLDEVRIYDRSLSGDEIGHIHRMGQMTIIPSMGSATIRP
jgi:hypothetical protein